MSARTLMVQGTGSSAGKSLLVTGLVRLFRTEGARVAPFKGQNMSLNSYPAVDGGEIGRAQVVQAEAAGLPPSVHMNPVLLKPTSERGSQVIVHGTPIGQMEADTYHAYKARLRQAVGESLDHLRARYDLVVIEGAGSPAEINLRQNDIVNMGVARMYGTPVLIVADIDRGGVFASLYGTWALLSEEDRRLLRGFVVNKFRGDPGILRPGLEELEERTGMRCAGVLPYMEDVQIDDEDSVSLDAPDSASVGRPALSANGDGRPVVAVVRLPRISNFTDFRSLESSGLFDLRYVSRPEELEEASLVILPGTKSTVSDLQELRRRGFEEGLAASRSRGAFVLGICGGFQMLGERILDPGLVEAAEPEMPGLGLMPMTTTFAADKITEPVRFGAAGAAGVAGAGWWPHEIGGEGYEIHMGSSRVETVPADGRDGGWEPLLEVEPQHAGGSSMLRPDGAVSADGQVAGTYVHGLFDDFSVVAALARKLGVGEESVGEAKARWRDRRQAKEDAYDRLAEVLRDHLDMEFIRSLVEEQKE